MRTTDEEDGSVPEPLAVGRHHTGLFWVTLIAELGWQRAARRLPASVRELAQYRAATVVGRSWCVDFGTMLQRLDGLDVDRLAHIDECATTPSAPTPPAAFAPSGHELCRRACAADRSATIGDRPARRRRIVIGHTANRSLHRCGRHSAAPAVLGRWRDRPPRVARGRE